MYLVFKDKFGDLNWDEKFEAESMESFVESRNKRVIKLGSKRVLFFVDSPRVVTELTWDGKIKGTYHPCEKDSHRLV
jgi:hypothetical protein